MATSGHHVIQDQNLSFLYNAKADKRGSNGGRKALNDISNSRKPSALHRVKKDVISIDKDTSAAKGKLSKATEKGKAGGRKALSDLTNSVKPRPKQAPSLGQKLDAVAEECISEQGFLHNHQKCIKAQMKTVDKEYFLKSVGLGKKALPLSSNKFQSYMKHSIMEELGEDEVSDELPGCCSPAPQSPKAPPYMSWEGDDLAHLMVVIETPKLK